LEVIHGTVCDKVVNQAMVAGKLKNFQRWMADENEAINARVASDQAREACISVFGKQSEYVLNVFILMHSN